jgi:predicted MPP superfamily phosphohydrolase
VLYRVAAVWLGFLNFGFIAACLCWMIWEVALIAGFHPDRWWIAAILFGIALIVSVYGIFNVVSIRITRVTVRLPNLPKVWSGRTIGFFSDAHLGHMFGAGSLRRVVSKIMNLKPDIVLIGGDLYDGTKVDLDRWAVPLAGLSPALGAYFVAGNHEEFSDPKKYLDAVSRTGVRILNNEKVVIEGLQIVGIHYRDSVNDDHFRSMIRQAALDRSQPSILLTHAPDRVNISEEEGFSLQLSGHTHGGQMFPYTRIASRMYGKFVYGLRQIGKLTTYTSYGAGTWGPPLRVGTRAEVVLIRLE